MYIRQTSRPALGAEHPYGDLFRGWSAYNSGCTTPGGAPEASIEDLVQTG
jgi:hypothetical protein